MDITRAVGGGRTMQILELLFGGEADDGTFTYVFSGGKEAERMSVWCWGRVGRSFSAGGW